MAEWGFVAFIQGQFYRKWSNNSSLMWIWKWLISNYILSPSCQNVKMWNYFEKFKYIILVLNIYDDEVCCSSTQRKRRSCLYNSQYAHKEPRYQQVWKVIKYRIWVRSGNCGCLVTWFCYQLIAKPGNKTAAVPWPDPYSGILMGRVNLYGVTGIDYNWIR